MSAGATPFGFGPSDIAMSPELAAFLRARLAGLPQRQDDVPAATPPGFTGYEPPTPPTGAPTPGVLHSGGQALGRVLGDMAMSGPRFTRDFLDGKIDPGSEEAAGGAFNAAASAMTGSMPFGAPRGALRSFGGRSAATADHAALGQAETLASSGADRQAIWDQTGWFQGADDKWRFEIPDERAALNGTPAFPRGEAGFTHDALAAAYPQMWDEVRPLIRSAPEAHGNYAFGSVHAFGPDADAQRSIALHEYQHAIQKDEGFAAGASTGDPSLLAYPSVQRAAKNGFDAQEAALYDLYRRHAGEVEARNVEVRRDFTPEQRRAVPPWETQDIPDEQQIVRFFASPGGRPVLSAPFSPVIRKARP